VRWRAIKDLRTERSMHEVNGMTVSAPLINGTPKNDNLRARPLAAVALEIVHQQAFLSGAMHGLSHGRPPTPELMRRLHDQPLWGTEWQLADGTIVDLSSEPTLLAAARALQAARWACRLSA
jgi:hypothetical protein